MDGNLIFYNIFYKKFQSDKIIILYVLQIITGGSCYLFLIQTKFKDFVEMCTDLFLVHDLDANHRHLAYFYNTLTCYGEHFFAVYINASDLFQLKVLYRC